MNEGTTQAEMHWHKQHKIYLESLVRKIKYEEVDMDVVYENMKTERI